MDRNRVVPAQTPGVQVRRRSRRPAIACTLCHKRKIRCNRAKPCSSCMRSRSGAVGCVYENETSNQPIIPSAEPLREPSRIHSSDELLVMEKPNPSKESQFQALTSYNSSIARSNSAINPSLPNSTVASSWTESSTPASTSEQSDRSAEALRLQLRIDHLESKLSKQSQFHPHQSPASASSSRPPPAPNSNTDLDMEIISSRLGGTFQILSLKNACLNEPRPPIAHSLSLKTRLFGQSHWAVSTARLIRDIFNTIGGCEGTSNITWTGLEKCKSLARHIKARRVPVWPSSPTFKLPPKDLADTLVENYLHTTESIYRILHLPNFHKQYEALWVTSAPPNAGFFTQLKLVLALGAVTYDEQFSLRTSAVCWVYEAQKWLAGSKLKLRLDIQSLQNDVLLIFAQERVGISGDSMWVSSGTLLRKAMHMGLHIDPGRLHVRSAYAAEMRRRLWNTVLEVNLQASLNSGGAPLISLSEFDTAPPGNFDDEQLEADRPVSKSPIAFTQASIAIALRQTFPHRLAIVKFLNDFRTVPGTYDETLRLDAKLREAYRGLNRTLSTAYNDSSSSARHAPSETQLIDFLMHRYFLSLHVPYFEPALAHGTAYAYSQKAVIESSLRLWRAACPPPAPDSGASQLYNNHTVAGVESDIPRLACCSSGFYPTVTFHAALLIALELRSQLQEEDQYNLFNRTHLRPDLVSVLENTQAWCLRVIEAGETNVKGYLLMSLVATQVSGMTKGLSRDRIADGMVKAVEGVEEKCLPVLERMAEGVGGETTGMQAADEMVGELLVSTEIGQGMEDWAMNWIFDDGLNSEDLIF